MLYAKIQSEVSEWVSSANFSQARMCGGAGLKPGTHLWSALSWNYAFNLHFGILYWNLLAVGAQLLPETWDTCL